MIQASYEAYTPMTLESFNSEYPAHIDSLITRPNTYYNGYVELEIRKPLYRSIPPEIIEFVKNCSVITKPGAFQLHIGILVQKHISGGLVLHLWDQFKMQNIKTVNYLEWILFMTEGKHYMNALFYFNCNPRSEYYGKIMVYYTDIHYTSPNTVNMQIITFDKLVSSIESWMMMSCENTQNGSTELMVIRAMKFLDGIYYDNQEVLDNGDRFPEGFTVRDILNADLKTDRKKYIANGLRDYVMTKLIHPSYGTPDPEAVVASFAYFLFRNHV